MVDLSSRWRSLAAPWVMAMRSDWRIVCLPRAQEPRWPSTCMKCGMRPGRGTMRVKAAAIDPNDPRQTIASPLRYRVPICFVCRVARVVGLLGLVALLLANFGRGRGRPGSASQLSTSELIDAYTRLAVVLLTVALMGVLVWPIAWFVVTRALWVTERGGVVEFRFRTPELAREFAACNEGATVSEVTSP